MLPKPPYRAAEDVLRCAYVCCTRPRRALDPGCPSLPALCAKPSLARRVTAALAGGGGDLPAVVVRHMLRAMALAGGGTAGRGSHVGNGGSFAAAGGAGGVDRTDGSSGGVSLSHVRLHVPLVLSVLRHSPAAEEAFVAGWAAAPLGLFLPWSGQMVSMMYDESRTSRTSGATAVREDPLLGPLSALAASYPQYLYAPLRMAAARRRAAAGTDMASAVPLLEATASPVMDEWVDALDRCTYPAQRYGDVQIVQLQGGCQRGYLPINMCVSVVKG